MDSITHIILGAAIGDTLLGKKIGRKAAAIGALAKTLPDFDLFYTGLNDARLYMCHHRGHTHSLLWQFIFAFPIAYLFYLLFKKRIAYRDWFVLFLVCLWGHSLLDTCTNYGTRLFLPLTNHAYSWNNLSIVDLVYTLPMLFLLLAGLIAANQSKWRLILIRSLLVYCGIYLAYSSLNKVNANAIVQKSLQENNISFTKFMSNPTILNNILWYGQAVNDSNLYIGEFSFLHPTKPIQWFTYPRNMHLLETHPDSRDIKTLQWFSNGYILAENDGDTLNVYCTKFGRTNMKESKLEKTMIFHYKLYLENGKWQMGMEEPNNENANMKQGFVDLWQRIHGELP